MDVSPRGLWSRATQRPNFCGNGTIYYVGQPPSQCSQFASSQKALWFHIWWINGCNMSRRTVALETVSSYISVSAHCETARSLWFVLPLPGLSPVPTWSHVVYLVSFTWLETEYTVHEEMSFHVSRGFCASCRCTWTVLCCMYIIPLRLFGNTLFVFIHFCSLVCMFIFQQEKWTDLCRVWCRSVQYLLRNAPRGTGHGPVKFYICTVPYY